METILFPYFNPTFLDYEDSCCMICGEPFKSTEIRHYQFVNNYQGGCVHETCRGAA
jgi:hypothetical protein